MSSLTLKIEILSIIKQINGDSLLWICRNIYSTTVVNVFVFLHMQSMSLLNSLHCIDRLKCKSDDHNHHHHHNVFPLGAFHGLGALLLESWMSLFQHQQDVWIRHHIATSVRVRCFVKDTSILCLVKPGIEPTFRLPANPLYHLSYCRPFTLFHS